MYAAIIDPRFCQVGLRFVVDYCHNEVTKTGNANITAGSRDNISHGATDPASNSDITVAEIFVCTSLSKALVLGPVSLYHFTICSFLRGHRSRRYPFDLLDSAIHHCDNPLGSLVPQVLDVDTLFRPG